MMTTVIEINGVHLDVRHDGEAVNDITVLDLQQDLTDVLDRDVLTAIEGVVAATKKFAPVCQSVHVGVELQPRGGIPT